MMGKNRRARVPSTEAAAAEMRQQARIKDETGSLMEVIATGDLGDSSIARAAKKIRVDLSLGQRKLGYVLFSRLTDATYLFELNVKGEQRSLAYTLGEGHEQT